MYVFGAFLIYTGIKMLIPKKDEKIDTENPMVKFANKFFKKFIINLLEISSL